MRQFLIILIELAGIYAITMIAAISPAFKRKPLVFLYPRREGIVASGLAVLLLAMQIGFAYFTNTASVSSVQEAVASTFAFTFSDLIRMLGISALIALPFVIALRVRKQPWLSAGFNRQTLKPSLQLGLALAIGAIFLTGKTYRILDGVSASEGYYLAAMLAYGLAVEFAFRGYILPRWMTWFGATRGWIANALLFVVWQIPSLMIGKQVVLLDLGLNLLAAFGMGLLLGWIMRKSGNVLAPGIYAAIHAWVQIL